MSPELEARFAEYGAYHRSRGNKVCHAIGIPLVVAGGARLLAFVPLFQIAAGAFTLCEVALAAALLYYVRLDRRLAVLLAAALGTVVVVGRLLTPALGATAFVLGWIFQLVGHGLFEKRAPAFAQNLQHVLVGPAWLFARGRRR